MLNALGCKHLIFGKTGHVRRTAAACSAMFSLDPHLLRRKLRSLAIEKSLIRPSSSSSYIQPILS
jgi:hypothetical protein